VAWLLDDDPLARRQDADHDLAAATILDCPRDDRV
jgi:hypothetical protein